MAKKIEPVLRSNILTMARAYAQATGKGMESISRLCHGDAPFLDKLIRREGSVTARKYDEVIGWFCDAMNWPHGVLIPTLADPEHKQKVTYGTKTKAVRAGGKGKQESKEGGNAKARSEGSRQSR